MPLGPSQQKFAEMILYVARETEGDRRCGATKLNKILFYADFGAHRKLGRAISGQEYQKLPHGPAPRALVPVVGDLEGEGACVWAERNYLGYTSKKLLALREPDLPGDLQVRPQGRRGRRLARSSSASPRGSCRRRDELMPRRSFASGARA
jgi:hypothetical protein